MESLSSLSSRGKVEDSYPRNLTLPSISFVLRVHEMERPACDYSLPKMTERWDCS